MGKTCSMHKQEMPAKF